MLVLIASLGAAAFCLLIFTLVTTFHREYRRPRLGVEAGRTAIVERVSPKIGGCMALYDEFLVQRNNFFARLNRVPYTSITRLGVQEYRALPVPQARVCIEYRDDDGQSHLAQLVCEQPDDFLIALREKIGAN